MVFGYLVGPNLTGADKNGYKAKPISTVYQSRHVCDDSKLRNNAKQFRQRLTNKRFHLHAHIPAL